MGYILLYTNSTRDKLSDEKKNHQKYQVIILYTTRTFPLQKDSLVTLESWMNLTLIFRINDYDIYLFPLMLKERLWNFCVMIMDLEYPSHTWVKLVNDALQFHS